jgi:hypothetical protein
MESSSIMRIREVCTWVGSTPWYAYYSRKFENHVRGTGATGMVTYSSGKGSQKGDPDSAQDSVIGKVRSQSFSFFRKIAP